MEGPAEGTGVENQKQTTAQRQSDLFLGKFVMCWMRDLLICCRPQLMIHTENVALKFLKKKKAGIQILSSGGPQGAKYPRDTNSHHLFSEFLGWYHEQLVMCLHQEKRAAFVFSRGVSPFKHAHVFITQGCFTWIHEKQIVYLLGKAHFHPPCHKGVLKWRYTQEERKQPHAKLKRHHKLKLAFTPFLFHLWPHNHQ